MEKMVNKERSPLSHGTAAAISMNLKSKKVALGIRARRAPSSVVRTSYNHLSSPLLSWERKPTQSRVHTHAFLGG